MVLGSWYGLFTAAMVAMVHGTHGTLAWIGTQGVLPPGTQHQGIVANAPHGTASNDWCDPTQECRQALPRFQGMIVQCSIGLVCCLCGHCTRPPCSALHHSDEHHTTHSTAPQSTAAHRPWMIRAIFAEREAGHSRRLLGGQPGHPGTSLATTFYGPTPCPDPCPDPGPGPGKTGS